MKLRRLEIVAQQRVYISTTPPPLSVSVLQNGDTALHIASFHEMFEISRALIERGARIDAVNLVGSTHPLC